MASRPTQRESHQQTVPTEGTLKEIFSIAVTAALMLGSIAEASADPPSYALTGFPVTPHQASLLGPDNVQEQSVAPTLTLGGMPASPHQIAVLTPRPKETIPARP
jgi:hypothetical protein